MADNERFITKTAGRSEVTFAPRGSRIMRLVLDGHLISGTVSRWDKDASWHPCAPNFDVDPKGILPRHGVMRDAVANVLSLRAGDPEASIRTRTLLKADNYPEVEVLRILTLLPRALTVESWYSNADHRAAAINHGEHVYFHAPKGWEGTTLNNKPIDDQIRNDEIFPWNAFNGLQIPGQPLILLNQTGLHFANPWTGRNYEGVYDQNYFSLSAVQGNPRAGFLGSLESVLPAHVVDSRKKSLTISVITR